MFISKFMTKDVVTLGRVSDIAEAKQLMIRYRIRHIPVTRSDRTLIGIVSDRDIRSAMPSKFFHDQGIEEMEAEQAHRCPGSGNHDQGSGFHFIVFHPSGCAAADRKSKGGAFPVVDEKLKVVGIISDRDLLNAFIHVMGIKEPGALLGIVVDEDIEGNGAYHPRPDIGEHHLRVHSCIQKLEPRKTSRVSLSVDQKRGQSQTETPQYGL
jgi:acetoin utilization protein AcuB